MAETVQSLLDAIQQEASFDVTSATALIWLNRRWRTMLGRARAYRKTVTIGTTVIGTRFYPVAGSLGVLELYSLEVAPYDAATNSFPAPVPYGRARRPDGYSNRMGRLSWGFQSEVGLFYADASGAAVQGVTLIPTPTVTGSQITGFAACEPPDLTNDASGNTLLGAALDGEYVEGLVLGALATGYRREGNVGLAQAHEAIFDRDTDELRRLARRRFRGPGPTQVRALGIDA